MTWVAFTDFEGRPVMVNVDTLKGITPDRFSDGAEAVRLWYADPAEIAAMGQDVVSTLLVRGGFGSLTLLLEAKAFP